MGRKKSIEDGGAMSKASVRDFFAAAYIAGIAAQAKTGSLESVYKFVDRAFLVADAALIRRNKVAAPIEDDDAQTTLVVVSHEEAELLDETRKRKRAK